MRLLPATRRHRIEAALLTLLAAFVVVTAVLFVFPAQNAPARADAIIVLGGGGPVSVIEGEKLAEHHEAPLLVYSLETSQSCRPDELHLTVVVRVACFTAQPQTTQGEAESIRALARADHLHRIIVVARTSQVTRARIRVTRCFSGQLLMVGVHAGNLSDFLYSIAYEWASLFKAEVLQRSC